MATARIPSGEDTVIVPAGFAWEEYQRFGAYICQASRSFRDVTYCGFYTRNAIQPVIAKIRSYDADVTMTHDTVERLRTRGRQQLADVVERVLHRGARPPGAHNGIMLLSAPEDVDTIHLAHPIVNDTVKDTTDRRIAWTQNQRYASLARLASGIALTSQL